MASIWCSVVGTGLALAASVYGTEVMARLAGVLCVVAAAAGGAVEWRSQLPGMSSWRFTRKLRWDALAAAAVVGAVVAVWPSPPPGRLGEVGRMVMGYAGCWVFGIFLIRSLTRCRRASDWTGVQDSEAADDDAWDADAGRRVSWLDRLALLFLPLLGALYLVRSTDAWVWASIAVGILLATTTIVWFAELFRRPRGTWLAEPPSSALVIGVFCIFLGQLAAATGAEEWNDRLSQAGWLITGWGVGLTMWLWKVRPLLVKAQGLRHARGDNPNPHEVPRE